MYKYHACAKIGNICFIWKVLEKKIKYVNIREVEKLLPMSQTRLEAKYLRKKYEYIAIVSSILWCNIVEFLIGKVTQ